jgi:hypothetical protein
MVYGKKALCHATSVFGTMAQRSHWNALYSFRSPAGCAGGTDSGKLAMFAALSALAFCPLIARPTPLPAP